jgi:capsule polysaccharide export protein KpsC/LpsZ
LATLTGTIGWEAFLEKIPVISFGFPWYGGIPCVQKYTKQLNIMEFQEETRFKFEKIDYEAIYNRLVNTLSDVSVKSECESYEKYIEFARRLQTMIERL